ncbi:MAG: hypothetical protein C0403_13415 [Desulfobacterium sp.]|nr:hypothetical protein [Desulfobacterium sp.]
MFIKSRTSPVADMSWGKSIVFLVLITPKITIKQNLKIKTFVGTGENALYIQIWTATVYYGNLIPEKTNFGL